MVDLAVSSHIPMVGIGTQFKTRGDRMGLRARFGLMGIQPHLKRSPYKSGLTCVWLGHFCAEQNRAPTTGVIGDTGLKTQCLSPAKSGILRNKVALAY